jgi:catechol 2,3-dioxygenase-like lactoylglutathione lyase family enzyme
MPVSLNHTIVYCRDKQASALFLSAILGLPAPTSFGPFAVVQVANDVSLDFLEEATVHPQHYAFLVDEDEFDQIHGRILARGVPYWADPGRGRAQEINTNDGGRGLYWLDPDSHVLEILTVPYGGWPKEVRP